MSATELAAKVRSGDVSAVEVTEAHLDRIAKLDSELGAYLHVDREEALRQATAVDAMVKAGNGGFLVGVPVAVKDNISTLGMPTTCASRILEGYVPPFDATVVAKLKEAGAIVIGKTNLDEFAMGTSCENSAFQDTHNPWDPDRSPGGSSGGSAAAVASEMAPLSLGSDTGGSIRMPAALCGIVGFKPTYGRISRYGLVAFGSSLDQIGPFGRSIEDTALLASVLSGHDPLDSTSLPDSAIRSEGLKDGSLKGLKVALPKQLFGAAINAGVMDALEMAIENLEREGVSCTQVDMPSIDYGVTTYYIIAPAEASSNLARFDGVRFGPQVQGDGHIGNFSATRGKLFGHEVKLRVMVGTYALSAGYYDAFYHRAQQVRGLMAAEFESVFRSYDLVMSPTSPIVAFKLGELKQDPMALKMLDLCTIPANMGGFPSLSLPCGFSQDLPVGMCLTGPVNGDERLLQTAYAIEQALPWGHRRPPLP
ncbi:MAG: Asp-tRNA(Asn)/Glu-tRNA(Gln) amidotransferase subunit GatA [Armatimonadetes bacterium]|nr:Asp-tRNA(Asn)/Glu-tRNA(Gln) amidotransferase subunit GatA [Armatimonadota bacterium]